MYEEEIDLLKKGKMTLASAESFTGGLFASTITSYSGVSSFFKGSIITYWSEIKHEVLKVPREVTDTYGVVSKECALEMVKGVKKLLNVDIAVSFTGNAGPTVLENKPVGRAYIGFAFEDKYEVVELDLKGDRNQIRSQAVDYALKKIKNFLQKK